MSEHNASRIALYYYCPFRGDGVAKTFLALAGAFVERGYTVDCLCVQTDGPHRDTLPDGVALVPLGSGNILVRIAGLVRYLRRVRPAALISGMDFANICGLARAIARVDTRIIADVQVTYSYYLNMRGGLIRLVGPYLIRWLLSKADAIVAVSDGVADDLARFLPARVKVATIHNPVETAQLENLAREPVDHPWFAAKAPPVVLGVGRLEAQKDFVSLIRAFRRVRDTAEARLIILGEGSQRPALEALVQELGLQRDVEMPGFVPNPYKYMAGSSVFVLSSIAEGFGNVVVEAMAVGTPVVSTDCESGPREILEDGAHGRLVPVGDVVALAAAVNETLSDRVTPTGLQKRAADFSLDGVAERFLEVTGAEAGLAATTTADERHPATAIR